MNERPYRTAADYAALEIKRRIIEQDLLPGTKLDQTTIANELGLSRIPVRQALASLAERGFVRMQAHRTAVVAPLSLDDVQNLYQLRNRMEVWALEEAVEAIGEAEQARLLDLTAAMEMAADHHDLPRYMELNREFHLSIFLVAGNPYLCRTLQSLFDLTERYQWMYLHHPASVGLSIDDHRRIVAVLREKDLKKLVDICQEHNKKTLRLVVDLVREMEERLGSYEAQP